MQIINITKVQLGVSHQQRARQQKFVLTRASTMHNTHKERQARSMPLGGRIASQTFCSIKYAKA